MITGIAHINLTVPPGTLDLAVSFYGDILGLTPVPVPALQEGSLAWFNIPPSTQQLHVAFGTNEPASTRHPCFRVESAAALAQLQARVFARFQQGGAGAPVHADEPGTSSGARGAEYPTRFFARDYAGNRLEFSL